VPFLEKLKVRKAETLKIRKTVPKNEVTTRPGAERSEPKAT
jgi:hypothetical protein